MSPRRVSTSSVLVRFKGKDTNADGHGFGEERVVAGKERCGSMVIVEDSRGLKSELYYGAVAIISHAPSMRA